MFPIAERPDEAGTALRGAVLLRASGRWPAIPALALTGMILCLSLSYGFQYRWNGGILAYFGPFSLAFFACAGIVGVAACRQGWAPAGVGESRRLGIALVVLAATMTAYFNSQALPLPWPLAVALIAGLPLAATALFGSRVASFVATGLGLGLPAFLVTRLPIDVEAANMLPIILAACTDLMAGVNPYAADYGHIATMPLFYLPGLYAAYCPVSAAGLDPRLVNVLSLAAILAIGMARFDAVRHPERVTLGLVPLLASPPAAQMMVHGHVWVYWLMLAAAVALLAGGRLVWAAVLAGVALASRQTAVFLVLPLAAYLALRLPPRTVAACAAVTLLAYALGVAFPALAVPDFLDYFYLGLSDQAVEVHTVGGNPMDQIALSGFLLAAGIHDKAVILQAGALLAAMAGLAAARRLPPGPAIILVGCAQMVVVAFNPFLHRYFYFPGLLTVALGIAWSLWSADRASGGAGSSASSPSVPRTM